MKLLIVDDEKIIRIGLRKIISNISAGYDIIGEASNGIQALEEIRDHIPDIVITDVKMPVMNGIDLVKNIRDSYPDMRIIILSGFDDFEYVRSTMKYGAVDYLLKPVNNNAISALLKEVEKSLEMERESRNEYMKERQKIGQSLSILREKFFKEWAKGIVDNLEERQNEIQIGFDDKFICLGILSFDDFCKNNNEFCKNNNEIDNINTSIKTIVEQLVSDNDKFSYYRIDEKQYLLISLWNEFEEDGEESFVKNLKQMLADIKYSFGLKTTAGVSCAYRNVKDLAILYNEALTALSYRMYGTNEAVIRFEDIKPYNCRGGLNRTEIAKKMVNFVNITDTDNVRKQCIEIVDSLVKEYMHPQDILIILNEVFIEINVLIPDFSKITDERLFGRQNFTDSLKKLNTLDEAGEYFTDTLCDITRHMQIARKEKCKRIVERARNYINEHYKDNITLEVLAGVVHMNQTYLSELFKQDTGESYIEYLTRIRLETARKLLTDPEIKVYEVGYMVGYDDPTYFSRIFKKKVGVTPSQYKEFAEDN